MSTEWILRDGSLLDPPARFIENLRTDGKPTGVVDVAGIPIDLQTIDITYCRGAPPGSDLPECYCVLGRDEFEKFLERYPNEVDGSNQEALETLLARLRAWKYGHTASRAGRLYERLYSMEFGSSCLPRNPNEGRSQELLDELDEKIRDLVIQPPDDIAEANALYHLRDLSHHLVSEYFGDEITVYRGMGFDLGNVANQILSNQVPEEYHVHTPVVLTTSLHEKTAREHSPLLMRVNVELDDIAMAPDLFTIVEKDGEYRTEAEVQIEGDAVQVVDREQVRAHEVGLPLHQVIESAFDGAENPQVHVAMAGIVESLVENQSDTLVAREEVNIDQSTKQQLQDWVRHYATLLDGYDTDRYFEMDVVDFVEQAVMAVCDDLRPPAFADGGSDSDDESSVQLDLTHPSEFEQELEDRRNSSIRLTKRVEQQEIQDVAQCAFQHELAVAIEDQNAIDRPFDRQDLYRYLAERLLNDDDVKQVWKHARLKAADEIPSEGGIDAIRTSRERAAKRVAYDYQPVVEQVLGVDRLALLEDYAGELAEVTAEHQREWIPSLSTTEPASDRERILFETLDEQSLPWQDIHLEETIHLLQSDTPLEEIYASRVRRVTRRLMFDVGIEAFRNNVRGEEPRSKNRDQVLADTAIVSSTNQVAINNGTEPIRSQEFINIDEIDPLEESVDRDRDSKYLVLFSARPTWKHEAFADVVIGREKLTERLDSAKSFPTAPSTLWGLPEHKRKIATELRPGDFVMFYTDEYAYTYSAEILGVELNPDLLDTVGLCDIQTVTGDSQDRGKYQGVLKNHYVYAVYLNNVRQVMVPSKELHQRLGDTIDYLNHSARLIEGDRLDPLTEFYGDLSDVIDVLDER